MKNAPAKADISADAGLSSQPDRSTDTVLQYGQELARAWSRQIDHLQQGMQQLPATLRDQTQNQIHDLTTLRDQAVSQLEKLQEATEENSEVLRRQTSDIFQELTEKFNSMRESEV